MRSLAGLTALVGLLWSCSDDVAPPTGDLGTDGSRRDLGEPLADGRLPWDGIDPKCPMGGPCVHQIKGEGKHAEDWVVIGERVTLTGKDLQDVDTVYVGATVAKPVSVSATQVVFRVPPRTPGGTHAIEVKAKDARRKYSGLQVRRLLVAAATDHTKLQTYDASSHAAGGVVDLPEAPETPLSVSSDGRFLLARGATAVLVIDLAREQAAKVDGLGGETAVSWTTADDDQRLLIATASGEVRSAALSGFPTLSAQVVASAPATTALVSSPSEVRIAGFHPTAAASESSVWFAAPDLTGLQWAHKGDQAFLLGTGAGLKALSITSDDGVLGLLALDGNAPQLGLLRSSTSKLEAEGSLAAPGAQTVCVAPGGSQLALGGESSSPALSYVSSGAALQLKTVSLGGTGPVWVFPFRTSRAATVAVLVGPKPSGSFIANRIELADLSTGTRLVSGGKAVLELADVRAGVGDPLVEKIHLLTGSELRSYNLTINASAATASPQTPHITLTAGKTYRWIAVQP